jgi:hypothetical protein
MTLPFCDREMSRSLLWNFEATQNSIMRALPAPSFLKSFVLGLSNRTLVWNVEASHPPTNRIMQTSLSVSGFCRASRLIKMSFPQLTILYDGVGHLGCQRSNNSLQMESELLAH